MDYEKDIVIDESALDVEWLEQPRLFLRYCRKEHEARRDMDYAKERLDVVRAKLDKKMRADPDKYDITRISEGAITNTVLLQPSYEEASTKYIEAKYEYGMSIAAVRAFDQRKTALENLARLHGQQYFAGPRLPRDLSEERQLRQQHSDQKVGKAMRRNKATNDD